MTADLPGPLAQRLGVTRAAILHVDDLGMCESGDRAFLELAARGLVTCGSVMVPCPRFAVMAEAAAADPALDLGIHFTLTSEWATHRWRPLSTRSPASGLVDADGFFPRDLATLCRHLVPEAAEAELAAQVERALSAGLRPTHCDAHMAGAMLAELLPCHVRLARAHGMVPVLPRRIGFAPDPTAYAATIAALEAEGMLLPDMIRGTLAVPAEATGGAYHAMVAALPSGVTHIALHCAAPGDIERIAPEHAGWRMREYALFAAGAVRGWCAEAGIAAVGYREVAAAWREAGWGRPD
jgi:predicted glycoside hydrolase/deacetylase ChbG (UPF0249 family)